MKIYNFNIYISTPPIVLFFKVLLWYFLQTYIYFFFNFCIKTQSLNTKEKVKLLQRT